MIRSAFVLLSIAISLSATVINVPADQTTIQAGIDAAVDGDIVLVQPGTYYENISFNGKDIIVGSLYYITRDTTYLSQTIIDGGNAGTVVSFVNGESESSTLMGFTITNGNSSTHGGGIICSNSNPTIFRNRLINNEASQRGGGISCSESNPNLIYLEISSNTSAWGGGGISCDPNSSPTIDNCQIFENQASDGGGISCDNYSNPSIINCTIRDNYADEFGGGLKLSRMTGIIENLIIIGNTSGSRGGGIDAWNSNCALKNVLIANNSAGSSGGGGLYWGDYTLSLINCTIANNTAGGNYPDGGGILSWASDIEIVNSVLWNNVPESIHSGGDNPSIIVSYSDLQGGEVGIFQEHPTTISWGMGNIDTDPQFYNASTERYDPLNTSPCNDAGTPDTLGLGVPSMDIRGHQRIFDIDGDASADIDQGCYEYGASDVTGPLPPFVTVIQEMQRSVTLQWVQDPEDDIEQFNIYRGSTPENLTIITSLYPPINTYTDEGLDVGEEYYYKIESADYSGNESVTTQVMQITPQNELYNVGSEAADFSSIQTAINTVYDGDTVLVYPGTYVENVDFTGKNIVLGSLFLTTQDTSYIAQTIIDGNGLPNVVRFINGETSAAKLTGFTIQGGYYDGGNSAFNGAGVLIDQASPHISHCVIKDNTISWYGGGICVWRASSPVLDNLTLIGNTATNHGGGIAILDGATPIISNSLIANNTTHGGWGGGIYVGGTGAAVSISNTTIANNTVTSGYSNHWGGGIATANMTTASLVNSIVWGNTPNQLDDEFGVVQSVQYSCVEGNYVGTGNVSSDPKFTETNLHLYANSPCINSAHPDSIDSDGTRADMGIYPYLNDYSGSDWYVSVSGNDEVGTGAIDNPFVSIQAGMNFVQNSQSVLVDSGSYSTNIDFDGKIITLKGIQGASSTILTPANPNLPIVKFSNNETSSTVVEGFSFHNSEIYGGAISFGGNSNPLVKNCVISNTISHHPITFIHSDGTLENCVIADNEGYSPLHFNANSYSPSIINCTFANNIAPDAGVAQMSTNAQPPSFTNCVMWNPGVIELDGNANVSYSIVEGGYTGTVVIDLDPYFISGADRDYRLHDYSPGIGVGTGTNAPVNDIDGNPRPLPSGSSWDIGAYENPFGTAQHMPITIHVPGDYATIQTGLNAAESMDTVLVAPGTYLENISFPPINNIHLIGQYGSEQTIIDGNASGSVMIFNNAGALDSSTVIQGITIRNGGSVVRGGGIALQIDSPKFLDCIILDNVATNQGGGVYAYQSDAIFESCKILSNDAYSEGGGVYAEDCGLSIRVSEINENVAHASSGYTGGGGLRLQSSHITLFDVTIASNSTNNQGGGIYSSFVYSNPTSTFDKVKIIDNTAHDGGGIALNNDSPIISNSSIIGNTAIENAGGIGCYYETTAPVLSNVIIAMNSANNGGGLFAVQLAAPHLFNVALVNNNASVIGGAAYYIGYSEGEMVNVTVDGNTAGNYPGVYSIDFSYPSFHESNFINNSLAIHNGDNLVTLDADSCWWGDLSGPYHMTGNSTGLGETVEGAIDIEPWLATPNTDAPPIPAQNVSVSGTGNDFINLEWDSSLLSDFAGYNLYYDTDESSYPYENSIDVGVDTTFTLSGLDLGTGYFLAVTVYDTDGNESWYSSEVTGTTRILEVQNLDIAGEEHLYHLVTHDPFVTFDYFDSMGETQSNYHLQISTDSTFQANIIWDSGEVASDATSNQYTGGALLDGVKYYLRAKVASETFWSGWETLAFGMNTEPSLPVQLSLIGDEVTISDVLLEISNSSDAEEDTLTYDFRLYDATQGIQLDSAIAVVQDPDGTEWEITTALVDNSQHWWTVQAYDGYEYSELAGPESFLINFENDDPAGFDLTSPLLDESIINQSPLFTWNPAVDPDPLDTVRYVLYLDTPDPGGETFYPGIDTSFQLDYNLEDNTTYHWKVVAHDLHDSETESNGGYQSFTINTSNDLPEYFELLYPVWDEMVVNLQPEFLWEASSDPDDETIVMRSKGKGRLVDQPGSGNTVQVITGYDFYLSTDSMLTDVVPVEVMGRSYSPIEDLLENQTYYWAVSAIDDSGGVTFTDTASFWTNAENEAPAEFSLLLPVEGEVLTVLSPIFTWEPSNDPDLYDGFGYHILLGSSPEDMDTLWSGEDTTLTLEWELDDNTTYYWSVFAEDWTGLTTSNSGGYQSFTVNTTNDLPEYFELLYPVWDEMVTNLQPEFLWEASSDPDDETIVLRSKGKGREADQSSSDNNSVMVITGYDFYLGTDPMLADVMPFEVLGTSYTAETDLTENQVYYWTVSALDDSGGVTFSDTASFWTNSENSAPSEFSLLTPVDDTESTTTPTFTWILSTDADFQDTLNYTLRYGTDVFSQMDVPNGSSTQFTVVEPLEDNTEYIWQVIAEDIQGATFATEFSSFFVNSENDDPGLFSLIAPDSAAWITNSDLMVVWEPSTDLEGADIEYVIHMGADNESLNPIDTINVNYYALLALEDGYYYWQIEAIDNIGGAQFSEIWSFLINVNNDPPDPFALTFPEADLVLTVQQPTFTWETSSSGDVGDHTSYRVELGNSAESIGVVYEGDSTFYTPESPLEDNSVYYWRVIAIDLAFATTVNEGGYQSFVVNTVNDAPTMAGLTSPDSVVVLSDLPTFTWNASTDVDPLDSLSYELHWWTDVSEMDSILTTETSVSPETPLADDNLQYFWNVITMDANGGIAHSEEKTFWVDFMPEVPAAFTLLGPDSASAGNGTRPELTWAEAIDPDPFDVVHYSVAVATDSLMENVIYEQVAHVEVTIPETDLENDTRYYWQVTAIDEDSLTTTSSTWTFDVGYVAIDQYAQIPTEFVLDQNYPNPFNPTTTISYSLSEQSTAKLTIFDIQGREVRTLQDVERPPGNYEVQWNGMDRSGNPVSTGVYFARMQAGDYSKTIKMVYLK